MPKPIIFVLGVITGVVISLTVMFAAGIFGKIRSLTASASTMHVMMAPDGMVVDLYPGMPADSVYAAVGAPSHVVHTWAFWKSCDVWMYTDYPAISIIMVDGRLYLAYQQQESEYDNDDRSMAETATTDTVDTAWELPLEQ